jgi:hypothetical protein
MSQTNGSAGRLALPINKIVSLFGSKAGRGVPAEPLGVLPRCPQALKARERFARVSRL